MRCDTLRSFALEVCWYQTRNRARHFAALGDIFAQKGVHGMLLALHHGQPTCLSILLCLSRLALFKVFNVFVESSTTRNMHTSVLVRVRAQKDLQIECVPYK
jgi:hypothetical protein